LKNATLTDIQHETHKLDLQGPKTFEILSKLCAEPLSKLKRFRMIDADVGGIPCIVSRSGYTGEKEGVELFFPKKDAKKMWDTLLEVGKPYGVLPCGLGARDTLRLECCLPLYGHELSLDITPLEAGLDWAVSLDKEFTGVDVLRKQKANGVPRTLAAIKFSGRQPVRADAPLFFNGKQVGKVASGTIGPCVNAPIALALVETAAGAIGTALQADVRGNKIDGTVVEKPFYKPKKA
jgi:aminomethyltransferase